MKNIVLLGALLLSLVNPVKASEKYLRSFFADVMTMQASFEQTVVDESGEILERSQGVLSLMRPGRFHWNYQGFEEELGQQIIADGNTLLFYDPDLEQVSKRRLEDAVNQVPSMSLVQDAGEVDTYFEIVDIGLTDGLSWAAMKPKDVNAGYRQMLVGFKGDVIVSIQLFDGLGNTTKLDFAEVSLNPNLELSSFEFTIPDGVDVIEE